MQAKFSSMNRTARLVSNIVGALMLRLLNIIPFEVPEYNVSILKTNWMQ